MSGTIPVGSTPGTIANLGLHPHLVNMIQDGWLIKNFQDALVPAQLFRRVARRERWEGGRIGETMTMTRQGLLKVRTKPKKAMTDPTPQARPGIEQWTVTARPYNETIDTHMPTSAQAIAELFTQDARLLGFQAGQTLDHVVRNKLFNAYTGGQTHVVQATNNSTSLRVRHLSGFGEVVVNGRPTPVSGANPLAVTIGNDTSNKVIGVTPDDPSDPDGPGVLTLQTAASYTAGDRVWAANKPKIIRAGGADTVLGIQAAHTLKWSHIRDAITRLRTQLVPPFEGGLYECHLDSTSESQLFSDPEFQNLWEGSTSHQRELQQFEIGTLMGCRFIRNEETPKKTNTDPVDDPVGFDVEVPSGANQGVPIHRVIILSPVTIIEKYLDESEFVSSAGVLGKIGQFSVGIGGVQAETEGIRYLVRPPLDRLQEIVSQTWSFKGDWGIPSDMLTGDAALFKRAVVIEHAG